MVTEVCINMQKKDEQVELNYSENSYIPVNPKYT